MIHYLPVFEYSPLPFFFLISFTLYFLAFLREFLFFLTIMIPMDDFEVFCISLGWWQPFPNFFFFLLIRLGFWELDGQKGIIGIWKERVASTITSANTWATVLLRTNTTLFLIATFSCLIYLFLDGHSLRFALLGSLYISSQKIAWYRFFYFNVSDLEGTNRLVSQTSALTSVVSIICLA